MEVKNKDGSYVDKDRVEALNYILSQLNKIPTIRSQKQYVNKLISTDFKHFIQFYKWDETGYLSKEKIDSAMLAILDA